MDCAACHHFESRLARLDRIHAVRLRNLWNHGGNFASQDEYNRIRVAEDDAKLEMTSARLDPYRHKQNEHKAT